MKPLGGRLRRTFDAMAAGARAPEGIERILAPGVSWTLREARFEEVGPWGRHEFEFMGRRPAKGPDYEEALRALRSFLDPFRNVLNPFLVGLVDAGCDCRLLNALAALGGELVPVSARTHEFFALGKSDH